VWFQWNSLCLYGESVYVSWSVKLLQNSTRASSSPLLSTTSSCFLFSSTFLCESNNTNMGVIWGSFIVIRSTRTEYLHVNLRRHGSHDLRNLLYCESISRLPFHLKLTFLSLLFLGIEQSFCDTIPLLKFYCIRYSSPCCLI